MICISISVVVIWFNRAGHSKNETTTYLYRVDINSSPESDFYVLLPAPSYYKNRKLCQSIISEMKITDGDGKINIEETYHGQCINISGNQNLSIIAEGKMNELNDYGPTFYLSMEFQNHTKNTFSTERFWIFSNSSNVSISIILNNDYPSGGFYEYNSKMTKIECGWQIIEIEEIIKVP